MPKNKSMGTLRMKSGKASGKESAEEETGRKGEMPVERSLEVFVSLKGISSAAGRRLT